MRPIKLLISAFPYLQQLRSGCSGAASNQNSGIMDLNGTLADLHAKQDASVSAAMHCSKKIRIGNR